MWRGVFGCVVSEKSFLFNSLLGVRCEVLGVGVSIIVLAVERSFMCSFL